MVTISIIGIEPPLGRQISRDMTPSLVELYELTSEDFFYVLPECYYVNNGVEQNMWNALVKVSAPHKFAVIEHEVAKVLHSYLKFFCVNISVEFYYYDEEHRYEFIDDSQPRFITEENEVYAEDYDDEEELHDHDHEHGEAGDDDIFLGNAFEELGHFKGEDK